MGPVSSIGHTRETEDRPGVDPEHCSCLRKLPSSLQTIQCSTQLCTGSAIRSSSTSCLQSVKAMENHPFFLPGSQNCCARPWWQVLDHDFRGLCLVTIFVMSTMLNEIFYKGKHLFWFMSSEHLVHESRSYLRRCSHSC